MLGGQGLICMKEVEERFVVVFVCACLCCFLFLSVSEICIYVCF